MPLLPTKFNSITTFSFLEILPSFLPVCRAFVSENVALWVDQGMSKCAKGKHSRILAVNILVSNENSL